MHWPAPITTQSIADDRGPELVTVEYRIRPQDREAFLEALEHARRRDGAYAWGIFEDTAEQGRMVETFLVESWMEHLHQHERVTTADRVVRVPWTILAKTASPKSLTSSPPNPRTRLRAPGLSTHPNIPNDRV
jgi:Transmembrane secretion effector